MHKGQVISGSNGIAGLVGFMPFDVDVTEIPSMMAEGKCFDEYLFRGMFQIAVDNKIL